MKTHRDPIKAAKQTLKQQLQALKAKAENDSNKFGKEGVSPNAGVNFDFNSSASSEQEDDAKLNDFYDDNGNQVGATLE